MSARDASLIYILDAMNGGHQDHKILRRMVRLVNLLGELPSMSVQLLAYYSY